MGLKKQQEEEKTDEQLRQPFLLPLCKLIKLSMQAPPMQRAHDNEEYVPAIYSGMHPAKICPE